MGLTFCKFLAQPPAQDSIDYKVRPGCSGFYPVQSWKPSRLETEKPSLSKLVPFLTVLMGEKFLPIPHWNFSCFNVCISECIFVLLNFRRFLSINSSSLSTSLCRIALSLIFVIAPPQFSVIHKFDFRNSYLKVSNIYSRPGSGNPHKHSLAQSFHSTDFLQRN